MQAGHDLDILVAEKVMGLQICKYSDAKFDSWQDEYVKNNENCVGYYIQRPGRFDSNGNCNLCTRPFYSKHWDGPISYSTNSSAAWEVIDRFNEHGGADKCGGLHFNWCPKHA